MSWKWSAACCRIILSVKKMKRFFRTLFHHKTLFVDSSSKIGNTHVASHKPPILPKNLGKGLRFWFCEMILCWDSFTNKSPRLSVKRICWFKPNYHRLSATSHFCDLNPDHFQSPYLKKKTTAILNPKTQQMIKTSVSLTRDCIAISSG